MVGGIAGGRQASQSAVSAIRDVILASEGLDAPTRLHWAITEARRVLKDTKQTGITTAILAIIDGQDLYYATLGDGDLAIVWPDGMVSSVLVPHHRWDQPSNVICGYIGQDCAVPPRTGHLRLEPGCLVLAMSDGTSDLLPLEDIAQRQAHWAPLLDAGEDLVGPWLDQLENGKDEEGRYLHSDNMTLALAYLSDHEPCPGCPDQDAKSSSEKGEG